LVCLVLAFVASTALPMNWGGVLLIIVSAGLFVLDVKAATHGALTVAGLICLVLGSLLMYSPIGARSPTLPDVSLSPIALAGVTAVAAVAGGALAVAAVRVHRHQPLVGSQRLIGAFGITRTTLDPDGSVRVGGQLWSAHARSGRLEVDSPVRVLARRGLTLEVERLDPKSVREQKETTT
jgi:membrane-bound serine protease (ClpP class)